MASLGSPSESRPFDWSDFEQELEEGPGTAFGWFVAGTFLGLALLLGFLVIYQTMV